MKVEAITLREIRMPLVHFFETSFGRTTERRILLLTIHTDGPEGWGECVAGEDPFYSEESIDTAWYATERYLAPALLGKKIERAGDAVALFGKVRGHRMAKGAAENALVGCGSAGAQVPLWKLLGGTQKEIPCGVSIGIQNSHEQLLEKIETELDGRAIAASRSSASPAGMLRSLTKIRARWPEIVLSCDANSAYTLDQIEHLKKFDAFNLLMIEQPLWHDDFYFHARLQKQLKSSICLDEAIHGWRDAQAALELGACKIINIKVGRVGGFSEARRGAQRGPSGRHSGLVRRHAGNRHWPLAQHRAFNACRTSRCRAMSRLPSAIGKKTSSSRRSKFLRRDLSKSQKHRAEDSRSRLT